MRKWLSSSGPRLVILAIAAVAVWISADTLAAFAGRLQWTESTKWGLPMCVDVLAVYSVALWLHPQTKPEQRDFAQRVAWTMLGVSIAGNAAEHIFRAVETHSDWVHTTLAIAWGSVPSVAAFVAIHMYALGTVTPKRERKATKAASSSAPEAPAKPERTESKPPVVEPPQQTPGVGAGQTPGPMKPPPPRPGPVANPQPGPLHSVPQPPERRVPTRKDNAEIHAWMAERGGATKDEILRHWKVGGGRALRALQSYEGKAA